MTLKLNENREKERVRTSNSRKGAYAWLNNSLADKMSIL